MVRFSESFWDKDPVGNNGYEVLVKRLKDGKKMCDEFSDVIRQRSKAEEDYGRTLIRIAQQSMGCDEIGTLRDSWEKVKTETEKIGFAHCELAKKLDDVDKSVKAFRDEQKTERTRLDEKMKRLQKEKKSAHENVVRCKKQYEQRCKELDNASETLESISHYTPKEEEKLRNKKLKAKTAQESADQQYQSAVKASEQTHSMWEREMEVSCEQFQTLEEERIRFLRNEMWLYANFGSQTNVNEDQMYEEMRLQLEKCDDAKDIVQFIHIKQTGSEKPVPLKYENYYHPHQATVTSSEVQRPKHVSLGRNITPPKPTQGYVNVPNTTSVGRHVIQESDDSNYSTVGQVRADPSHGVKQESTKVLLVKASFDYPAQGPEEINLRQGDIIEILQFEDKDWGRGRNQRTGEIGAFPVGFVQKFS